MGTERRVGKHSFVSRHYLALLYFYVSLLINVFISCEFEYIICHLSIEKQKAKNLVF